jgi:hypothetical protein
MADQTKPTPTQRKWLEQHVRSGGTLSKFDSHKTYDFVGRARSAGWVTIADTEHNSWPYNWASTTITDAGRSILQ